MAAGRPLPHNRDAESSVLGGILLDPQDALNNVLQEVDGDDFYFPAHRLIFDAIVTLEQSSKPIDILSLEEQLRSDGTLDKVGGTAVLAELASKVPTAQNIGYHARIVRDKATLRRLIRKASEIATEAFDEPASVDEFVDASEQSIFELAQRSSRSGYVHAKDLLITAFNAIERRYDNKDAITGVPTGFADFDELTGGLQGSDLVILAARPSVGKTALCLNMAQTAAIKHKIPVLMFSLEMSKESLIERILCAEARVDSQKLRSGFLDQNDWMNLTRAASRVGEAPIWIDDSAAPTVLEIRAKVRRFRSDKSIFTESDQMGLIIVDYLQLARGYQRRDNREQEVAEISRSLKALAKEVRLPVLALSQLRRGVEDRKEGRPQLSDLRESGAIEQDADVIAFIHRSDKDREENTAELIIGKQRNGPIGSVKLVFMARYTRFESITQQGSGSMTGEVINPGEIIGRYSVLGPLGTGSMGDVLLATDTTLKRKVAIKLLRREHMRTGNLHARFKREARAVAAINHPNVVQVFDIDEYGGRPYYVMEYLAGADTQTLLDQMGRLEPATVAFIGHGAAIGLNEAASAGVVHRDVKPANIVVTDRQQVKVTDFGLAKASKVIDTSANLTVTGTTVGTPDYISPEQARGEEVDGRTDVYSLGCTMYHLLGGHPPFRRADEHLPYMEVITRHISSPVPTLAVDGLPDGLADLIKRMMAKRPAARPSYPEIVAALSPLVEPGSTMIEPAADEAQVFTASVPQLPRSRSWWVTLTGIALLLATLAASVLFLF